MISRGLRGQGGSQFPPLGKIFSLGGQGGLGTTKFSHRGAEGVGWWGAGGVLSMRELR